MASEEYDREAEIARLTRVAEQVARRTNTRFVIDPDKKRNFAVGAPNRGDHERETVSESDTHPGNCG